MQKSLYHRDQSWQFSRSGILASYTTEILPYGIRAKGFTWLNFCVTAALFFNQYVNAIALEALAWKYYLFYCVFIAFEVIIIYFFIVETRYTPLEEIAKFFDGEDAVDIAEITNAEVKDVKVHHNEKEDRVVGNVEEVKIVWGMVEMYYAIFLLMY